MPTATTTKQINLERLDAALGGVGLQATGNLEVVGSKTITAPASVTLAALNAAITAHAYVDRIANRADLVTKANNALTANATFLAISSPTNAQVLAQTQVLTRECSGLIRLLLGALDDTSGT